MDHEIIILGLQLLQLVLLFVDLFVEAIHLLQGVDDFLSHALDLAQVVMVLLAEVVDVVVLLLAQVVQVLDFLHEFLVLIAQLLARRIHFIQLLLQLLYYLLVAFHQLHSILEIMDHILMELDVVFKGQVF